jgi:uncharacterized protein (TIGR02246 family)
VPEQDVAGELVASFVRAWNEHDMDALAALFHEDAVFVNVLGDYFTDREQIRAQHAAIHEGPYKNSVLRARVVNTRELAPGVLMVHVRTELDGDGRAPGHTRQSLVTFVIERRIGQWSFAAAHNTLVTPSAG